VGQNAPYICHSIDIIPEEIVLEAREALSLVEELSVKEICIRGTVSEKLFSPEK
jgi:hypothetical protein